MGDRCYLEMTLFRKDLSLVRKIVGYQFPYQKAEGSRNLVRVEITEANYGLFDEREELARKGVPFIGHHSEGGDYAAEHFIGLRVHHFHHPISREGKYTVELTDQGFPIASQMKSARLMLRVEKRIKSHLGLRK